MEKCDALVDYHDGPRFYKNEGSDRTIFRHCNRKCNKEVHYLTKLVHCFEEERVWIDKNQLALEDRITINFLDNILLSLKQEQKKKKQYRKIEFTHQSKVS